MNANGYRFPRKLTWSVETTEFDYLVETIRQFGSTVNYVEVDFR